MCICLYIYIYMYVHVDNHKHTVQEDTYFAKLQINTTQLLQSNIIGDSVSFQVFAAARSVAREVA